MGIKVIDKKDNRVYTVATINHDVLGRPTFLVYDYENNIWHYRYADEFRPLD